MYSVPVWSIRMEYPYSGVSATAGDGTVHPAHFLQTWMFPPYSGRMKKHPRYADPVDLTCQHVLTS